MKQKNMIKIKYSAFLLTGFVIGACLSFKILRNTGPIRVKLTTPISIEEYIKQHEYISIDKTILGWDIYVSDEVTGSCYGKESFKVAMDCVDRKLEAERISR